MSLLARILHWLIFGPLPRALHPASPPISRRGAERLCLVGSITTSKRGK